VRPYIAPFLLGVLVGLIIVGPAIWFVWMR